MSQSKACGIYRCPGYRSRPYDCTTCDRLFPEFGGKACPCTVLYVADVIKVAEMALSKAKEGVKEMYETPRDRYLNDNHFRVLVDMMVAHIIDCRYTPSEMREAAILASIIYEEHTIREFKIPKAVENAFRIQEGWLRGGENNED